MRRQLMAMVLTVSSAVTDEVAKAPVDTTVKPRQHAVSQRHPAHASSTGSPVCEKVLRDRLDERNISSVDGYFYTFDH